MVTEPDSTQEQVAPVAPNPSPVQQEQESEKKEEDLHEITTLNERTIAMLSYVGPLAIVPFYLKKDSSFCRFHGKQGMLLLILFFFSKLFSVLDLIMDLMLILQVVLFFYMGMAALSGKWKKLPLLYNWSCQLETALSLKTKEEELEGLQKQTPKEENPI